LEWKVRPFHSRFRAISTNRALWRRDLLASTRVSVGLELGQVFLPFGVGAGRRHLFLAQQGLHPRPAPRHCRDRMRRCPEWLSSVPVAGSGPDPVCRGRPTVPTLRPAAPERKPKARC
jgi:hypothetical protein